MLIESRGRVSRLKQVAAARMVAKEDGMNGRMQKMEEKWQGETRQGVGHGQRQRGSRGRLETETGQRQRLVKQTGATWRETHTRHEATGWAGLGLVSVSTWQTWLAGKLAGERVDEYLHKAGSLSGLA